MNTGQRRSPNFLGGSKATRCDALPVFDVRKRSSAVELMDAECTSAADLAACLHDLAVVNSVTLARLPLLGFVARAAGRASKRPLRVLDVACGEGDALRRLHRWSRRTQQELELVGLDTSSLGLAAARAATPPSTAIAFHEGNAFGSWPGEFDLVISSLFTHHLTNDEVVAFLRLMEERATLGWMVNDLHRHVLAFHGFRVLSSIARWHRFVRHDGPVSVARSFRRTEWEALLTRAGVPGIVRWHLPFRYCVSRLR